MNSAGAALIRQIITFCGVGGLNTLLSLAIILGLSEIFHVHYVLANITGYAAGLISGFIMHKKITFKTQTGKTQTGHGAAAGQFAIFLSVFAVGYAVQLEALMLLVERIHIPDFAAQIMAWAVYVAVSFAGHKYFTFHGGRHE